MNPKQLTMQEVAALITLLQQMVMADRRISPDERGYVRGLSKLFEPDLYAAALSHSTRRLQQDGIEAIVDDVARPEAHQCIYDLIVQTAAVDGIDEDEIMMLSWLEQRWNLKRPEEVQPGARLVIEGDDDEG